MDRLNVIYIYIYIYTVYIYIYIYISVYVSENDHFSTYLMFKVLKFAQ